MASIILPPLISWNHQVDFITDAFAKYSACFLPYSVKKKVETQYLNQTKSVFYGLGAVLWVNFTAGNRDPWPFDRWTISVIAGAGIASTLSTAWQYFKNHTYAVLKLPIVEIVAAIALPVILGAMGFTVLSYAGMYTKFSFWISFQVTTWSAYCIMNTSLAFHIALFERAKKNTDSGEEVRSIELVKPKYSDHALKSIRSITAAWRKEIEVLQRRIQAIDHFILSNPELKTVVFDALKNYHPVLLRRSRYPNKEEYDSEDDPSYQMDLAIYHLSELGYDLSERKIFIQYGEPAVYDCFKKTYEDAFRKSHNAWFSSRRRVPHCFLDN